jgi:hypothetical protein
MKIRYIVKKLNCYIGVSAPVRFRFNDSTIQRFNKI